MMKCYGRASLDEFLQDRVVYRNLVPCDASLPALDTICSEIGLPAGRIPRKIEVDYARVILHLLELARQQDGASGKIQRLIFVGDTRVLDGTAFVNICKAGGWPGLAFIGSETTAHPQSVVEAVDQERALYLANRWCSLQEFDQHCAAQKLPVDENAAVIIDLDKTALGARGRNGQVIDQARVQAVQETVAGFLGSHFKPAEFRAIYEPLNEPEFHIFTSDNQDYLAYICLVVGAGLYGMEKLMEDVRSKQMRSFEQFIAWVDQNRSQLPDQLGEIHEQIYQRVKAGDPTPFKAFRYNEYKATIRRFGLLADSAGLEDMLAQEILITQEVRNMARKWRKRGALLFGLSDKPDEAALPSPELASKGYLPLHKAMTHAVGE
jgi:hypothetical protein